MLQIYYLVPLMKAPPFMLRCAAFLLILVFSQKAGAGLLLHNLLHNTTENSKIPEQENEKSKGFSYNCTCVDDFLMPFAETEALVYSQPVFVFINPVTFFKEHISFHTSVFSFLRGPPAGKV